MKPDLRDVLLVLGLGMGGGGLWWLLHPGFALAAVGFVFVYLALFWPAPRKKG